MSKQSERRRRVVRAFAPAVGLLAAGLLVWQGSYAAFSASTTDNGNAWATGTLTLQNNGGSAGTYASSTTANFGGSDLVPGASGSECLTVDSTGSTSGGDLAMFASAISDDAAGDLTDQITVTVVAAPTTSDIKQDCTGFAALTSKTTVLPSTALTSFPATYAAATPLTIAAGDKVAYQLNWTFASTGDTTTDDALQGKTATASFTWQLQS